jgi:hypothetical protein
LREIQKKVLDFLKELKGERLEFDPDQAMSTLSITREELEEALFSLQDQGYLKIFKIPASSFTIKNIKDRLDVLDTSFLLGDLTVNEYQSKWSETIGVIDFSLLEETPSYEIEHIIDLKPLPPILLTDIVGSLLDIFSFIEKLENMKNEVSQETYAQLMSEYSYGFVNSTDLLNRFAYVCDLSFKKIGKELQKLKVEFELIDVDSKIRKLNREEKLNSSSNKLKNLLKNLDNFISRFSFSITDSDERIASINEELLNLKKTLEAKLEEYKIYEARILIEGDSEEKMYGDKIKILKNEIKTLEDKISELSVMMEDVEKKKDLKDGLGIIQEKCNKLRESGLLDDSKILLLNEATQSLKNFYNVALELKKIRKNDLPQIELLSTILSILQKSIEIK